MSNQNQSEIEAIYLRAAMLKPHINMCMGSRRLIENHLDEQLLPATLENITNAIDVLDCLDQLPLRTEAHPAPALRVVPPVEQAPSETEEPAVDLRKLTVHQLRDYIRKQKANPLPSSYSKDVIQRMSRAQYERLSINYGSQQVRDRLVGKS